MIGKLKSCLYIIIFIALGCFNGAYSNTISVDATIDKDQIALNDTITYTLTMSGSSEEATFDRAIFKNFVIVSQSTSRNYSFFNGSMQAAISKSFILRPKQEGKFNIPEAVVTIDNNSYSTRPFVITVSAKKTNPLPNNAKNTVVNSKPQRFQGKEDTLLLADTNKKQIYEGEEVVYSLYLLRQMSIPVEINYSLPTFGNGIVEQLERNENLFRKEFNGNRYYIQEIEKLSLFLYEPGELYLDPAIANMQISVFFSPEKLQSNGIQLTVLPLPQENQPENFSGLVGEFSLEMKPIEKTIIQNKPIALKIIVKGNGNIKNATQLTFKEDPQLKIYQSSVDDFITYKEAVVGERHFEYIVVPKSTGELTIPSFSISYYSPKEQQYKTLSTKDITIDVMGGVMTTPTSTQKETVTLLNQDLHYLKTITSQDSTHYLIENLLLIGLGLLNICLILWNMWTGLKDYAKTKSWGKFFKKRSYDIALKQLNDLNSKDATKKEVGTKIQQIILDYLSSKLNRSVHGLVYSDLETVLKRKKTAHEKIEKLTQCLEACSFLAYTPENSVAKEKKELISQAKTVLQELQKK